ncbi:peptidoglycan-binding LysM [Calycina marina]|uniref:Peptidoglycan-binding LysM n=1 Tax=Calycina marina TaxID=1763456 RepID=A0A9P7YUG2_9HELO|nr:peptidoglycan-binding LysM [Calycina marina]
MGRWSYYDTDEERLPAGMQRTGYDADTQTYTYRDAENNTYEGGPGSRYGELTKISSGELTQLTGEDDTSATPLPVANSIGPSWRHETMPLLKFMLLIGLFFTAFLWYILSAAANEPGIPTKCKDASKTYIVQKGDTCWDIAEGRGIDLQKLLDENQGLNCDRLEIGSPVCIPKV